MILREIAPEIATLLHEYNAVDTEDERREQIEAELERLELVIDKKADAIADYISHSNSQIAQLSDEIDRLSKLMKQRENKAEWLKRYLANCLTALELDELDTDFHRFTFRKSEVLRMREDAQIPREFCTEIPAQLEPQKNLIKAAIKSGAVIPGAWIETKRNLQIS